MINFDNARANQTRSLEFKSSAARPSRIARLAGWLGLLLLATAFCPSVRAAQSAVLSWNGSSDPSLAGYNVYYGGTSGNYTNSVSVGNVTNATISGLTPGVTYYFAATAVDASGTESGFSTEISYTVPVASSAQLQLSPQTGGLFQLAGAGIAGHTYQILASTNLVSWVVIGSQIASSSGSFQFTDTSANNFPTRFYRTLDTQQ